MKMRTSQLSKTIDQHSPTDIDLFNDRPIKSPGNDAFGRLFFAKSLAKALSLPSRSSGFVVAIEGGWGSGKTSMLNVIESILKEDTKERPIILRFDPWLISGSESLIESFLIQLAATLNKTPNSESAKKAATFILRFANLLAPIRLVPGVEPWGSLIQKALETVGNSTKNYLDLSDLDLYQRKDDVLQSLRSLDRPVVAMIDDIDRLNPIEIRQIFQLVKAVADFERVAYLLAYDISPVHKALSFDGNYDGAAFIEKIVQIAYQLPPLRPVSLRRYLEDRLVTFIEQNKIRLHQFEEIKLMEALNRPEIVRTIRNPRDVSRLMNRLRVSALTTRDEANFADTLVFELVALRFPHILSSIRQRPLQFTLQANNQGPWSVNLIDQSSVSAYSNIARPLDLPAWKIKLWETMDDDDRQILWSQIDFLFPGFRDPASAASAGNAEAELRICTEAPLMRLLSSGPSEDIYSAQEARMFLSNSEERDVVLREMRDRGNLLNWLLYVQRFAGSSSVENPLELVLALTKCLHETAQTDKMVARELVDCLGSFALALIKEADSSTSEDILLTLCADEEALILGGRICAEVVSRHRSRQKTTLALHAELMDAWDIIQQGRQLWLGLVRGRARHNPESLLQALESINVLLLWNYLAEEEEGFDANHFVISVMEDSSYAKHFLALFQTDEDFIALQGLVKDWDLFTKLADTHPELLSTSLAGFIRTKWLGTRRPDDSIPSEDSSSSSVEPPAIHALRIEQ